jgi:hypothetical protein
MGCVAWPPAGYCANAPNANKNVQEMTAVLMVFTVKVSLARGAASPFEMRVIPQRRADQLTMHKKNYGQRSCCFSSTEIWDGQQLCL